MVSNGGKDARGDDGWEYAGRDLQGVQAVHHRLFLQVHPLRYETHRNCLNSELSASFDYNAKFWQRQNAY